MIARRDAYMIALVVAAALLAVAAWLDFAGRAHALGWGLIGLAVFAIAGLFALPARAV